jgi:hypothetical protein
MNPLNILKILNSKSFNLIGLLRIFNLFPELIAETT